MNRLPATPDCRDDTTKAHATGAVAGNGQKLAVETPMWLDSRHRALAETLAASGW